MLRMYETNITDLILTKLLNYSLMFFMRNKKTVKKTGRNIIQKL